jgi:hypothetical protein
MQGRTRNPNHVSFVEDFRLCPRMPAAGTITEQAKRPRRFRP